jgi:hypothetical protein
VTRPLLASPFSGFAKETWTPDGEAWDAPCVRCDKDEVGAHALGFWPGAERFAPFCACSTKRVGVPAQHFGAEIQMFADRELVPDRVTGAAEFLSADDRSRPQAHGGIEHASLTPEAHSRPRSGLACGSGAKRTISSLPAPRRLGAIRSDRAFAWAPRVPPRFTI